MQIYTFQVRFTEEQLTKIYTSKKKVVLVKESAQRGDLTLAWVAFQPLEENVITWDTDFLVYASKTALQNGAQLKLTSSKEAAKGHLYRFENGHFSEEGAAKAGAYSIYYAMQGFGSATFGLAQTASINGVDTYSPISAIAADYNDKIELTPIEKVSIFLQSSINNGTVISTVSGQAKMFDFTNKNALAAKYDSQDNVFLPDTLQESSTMMKRFCRSQ